MTQNSQSNTRQLLLEKLEEYLAAPVKITVHHVFGEVGDPLTERYKAYDETTTPPYTFKDCINDLMIEKGVQKASSLYKAACISKSTFSKITNYRGTTTPTKETVAALVIGLHLNEEEATRLFNSAGYHFGNSTVLDKVIRFFINERHYDIDDVNYCLVYFGEQPLGEKIRENSN